MSSIRHYSSLCEMLRSIDYKRAQRPLWRYQYSPNYYTDSKLNSRKYWIKIQNCDDMDKKSEEESERQILAQLTLNIGSLVTNSSFSFCFIYFLHEQKNRTVTMHRTCPTQTLKPTRRCKITEPINWIRTTQSSKATPPPIPYWIPSKAWLSWIESNFV